MSESSDKVRGIIRILHEDRKRLDESIKMWEETLERIIIEDDESAGICPGCDSTETELDGGNLLCRACESNFLGEGIYT